MDGALTRTTTDGDATPDGVFPDGPAASSPEGGGPAGTVPPLTLARLADRIGRLWPSHRVQSHEVIGQVEALDLAVYRAVAVSPTPDLDRMFQRLSDAANFSRLWFGVAGMLAVTGGTKGRRAAVDGVVSIGVASLLANQVVKRLAVRARPTRDGEPVPDRLVRMPTSRSFPSGHTASAFAFAASVSNTVPGLSFPLTLLAAGVGYSRVHTGVHFPADVLFGSVLGATCGETTSWALGGLRRRHAERRTSGGRPQ